MIKEKTPADNPMAKLLSFVPNSSVLEGNVVRVVVSLRPRS